MEKQRYFFEILRTRIPDKYRLAEVVAEELKVSTDSAYRRIRGEKELSFTELYTLSKKFSISVDEIFSYQSRQSAMFHYMPVDLSNQESYIAYIKRLLGTMTAFKSVPEKELYFSAQDIPFYHFLSFPELLFFKLYAWYDTLNRNSIPYSEFYNNLDRDAILPIYQQMAEAYQQIPSKEIWTNQTIDTILRLLEHYFETRAFEKKESVLLLVCQLSELMNTVKKYADDACKGGNKKTPFHLFLCSVDLENNFMLIKRGENMSCNIKLYTVNSIATENKSLCMEMAKWFDDLISKSILISGTSTKERLRFFQTSQNKIDVLINKIELSASHRAV